MCVFERVTPHTKHQIDIALPIPIPDDLPEGIIIAWRRWGGYRDGATLRSPVKGTRWTPGKPLKAHTIITPGTNCGIYGYAKEPTRPDRHEVWGEVALWGTVYEHGTPGGFKHGFTGEYAYPLSLFCPGVARARELGAWKKLGVYINYYDPTESGADEKGYVALL